MKQLYPWEKWFKKKRFTLRWGRDYLCSQESIAMQVRTWAAKHRISTKIIEGAGWVEVFVTGRIGRGKVADLFPRRDLDAPRR